MLAGPPPRPNNVPGQMLGRGRPSRRLIIGDGSEFEIELLLPLSLRRVDSRLMNDDELGFIF